MKAGYTIAFVGALMGLLAGSATSAQMAPGRSGMSSSTEASNVDAYRELRAFGRCIASEQRKVALLLIATVPNSADEQAAFRRHVYGERDSCLFDGSKMSMSTPYARGAIAEGLLRKGGVPDNLRLAAPLPAEVRDLHDVARCYASGHRAEVDAILATQVGSAQEVAAVRASWDSLQTCMAGAKVRLTAPWIRFLLAEAVLRLPPPLPAGQE